MRAFIKFPWLSLSNRLLLLLVGTLLLSTAFTGCSSGRSAWLTQRFSENADTAIRGQSATLRPPSGNVVRTARVPVAVDSQRPAPTLPRVAYRNGLEGGWSGFQRAASEPRPRSVILTASVETIKEDAAVRAWTEPEAGEPSDSDQFSVDIRPDDPGPAQVPSQVQRFGHTSVRLKPPIGLSTGSDTAANHNAVTVSDERYPGVADDIPGNSLEVMPAISDPRTDYSNARTWQDVQTVSSATPNAADGITGQLDVDTTGELAQVIPDDRSTLETPASLPGEVGDSDIEAADSQAIGVVPPAREPTMFDRFKDLYTPKKEDVPTDALRRQFRKFQSPWNLFGDREAEESTPTPPPEETQPVVPADSVNGSVETDSPERALKSLILELETELNEWPRDAANRPTEISSWRRKQTDLRMLYAVASQPGSAVALIPDLPPAEQEFWQSIMLAVSYYRANEDTVPREQSKAEALEQLRIAVRRLQSETPLQVRRLAFCNAIHGFGSIDAFPTSTFRPGEPVLLYAELENFQSRHTTSGTYRTEFGATLEIRRAGTSEPLETIRLPVIADESISERTDYYQSYELTIPAHLRPGRYAVRLVVRDQLDLQSAEGTAEFDVR
jgi:hypothetical protein